MSVQGSTLSSESFYQMTNYGRLADVQGEIFETQVTNGSFARKQTLVKNSAMSELRTKLTLEGYRFWVR